ncbi:MAG: NUDIX hydrolase [Verrucomicrobiota bacterium]
MTDRDRALRVIGEGRYIRLVSENGWEYATRPKVTGIVVIVAVTTDRKLVLVEQPRVAVHNRVIELPAGMVGDVDANETLVDAARRELIEETGFDASEMTLLAEGPIAVGITDEVISFYKAGPMARVGPGGGDEHEDITVHEVPLTELRSFIAAQKSSGRLIDPKIYAGLFLAGVEVPR